MLTLALCRDAFTCVRAMWRQDLRQAWARALNTPSAADLAWRNPSDASFLLIGIRMSDATFGKLVNAGTLHWNGTWGSGRLTGDIDRNVKDENEQPLYQVFAGMRAVPKPAPADYPQFA